MCAFVFVSVCLSLFLSRSLSFFLCLLFCLLCLSACVCMCVCVSVYLSLAIQVLASSAYYGRLSKDHDIISVFLWAFVVRPCTRSIDQRDAGTLDGPTAPSLTSSAVALLATGQRKAEAPFRRRYIRRRPRQRSSPPQWSPSSPALGRWSLLERRLYSNRSVVYRMTSSEVGRSNGAATTDTSILSSLFCLSLSLLRSAGDKNHRRSIALKSSNDKKEEAISDVIDDRLNAEFLLESPKEGVGLCLHSYIIFGIYIYLYIYTYRIFDVARCYNIARIS